MSKYALLLLYTSTPLFVLSQYKTDAARSTIRFKIKNLGFNVDGQFGGIEGNISFDPADPSKSDFKVSINATTVNTGNDLRDSHLRQETYFDTDHYPRIFFRSSRIAAGSKKGSWTMFGKLIIKDHAKDISFPFTAEEAGGGYRFKGGFAISRKDFGVGGSSIISDNAEISLDILAGK